MTGVGEREDTSGTRALVSSLPWADPKRLSAGAFARALATICEGLPPAQLPVSLRAAVASREAMAAVRASPLGPLTVFQPLSAGAAALAFANLGRRPERWSNKPNLSSYWGT